MYLPKTDTPLVSLAVEKKVNPSDIENSIKNGTVGFILDAWVALSIVYLKDRETMENLTPVGGLLLGREIFEQVIEQFEEETAKE